MSFCFYQRLYIYPSKRATSARATATNPNSTRTLMVAVRLISLLDSFYKPEPAACPPIPIRDAATCHTFPQKRSCKVHLLFLGVAWKN